MDLKLSNKVVIVTGGSRGIGKAIVINLLYEGAFVFTCSRSMSELKLLYEEIPASFHKALHTYQCDVLNFSEVSSFVELVVNKMGRLDGLVTNAGSGSIGSVFETTQNDWIRQHEIKLFSVLNLVNAGIGELKKSESGKIVIMNGVTANHPDKSMAAVSASRASVRQVSYMLAEELAADNICVNTVNVGAIDTNRQYSRYERENSTLSYPEWLKVEANRRAIPLGRFGHPDEVAPIVSLLLSPLSSYTTGSTIDISGGLNAK